MFITRLISGIILLAIVISTGILGGPVFWLLVTLISLLGVFEFCRMLNLQKSILFYTGSFLCLGFDVLLFLEKTEAAQALLVLTLLIFMVIYVVTYPKLSAKEVFASYTGWVYAAVLLSFLYRIRMEENGILLLWLVFIGAWGSDTCAYCAGKLFGKHKVFPELSPKKTLEGCIGGAAGTALIAGIYAVCINKWADAATVSVFQFVLTGIAASVISQVGDLAASAMKRNYGIKDYGKLIPGHGGILDRFDSIIFTAPLVYYLVRFFTS